MADGTEHTGFGKFVPGFEFLQNLARQATGGLGGNGASAVPQMPSLGNWVAPTFNVEELEKRIQELKAVQFWLDQNSRALAATIQALEVQKMTLATLKGMNFNLGEVAQVLRTNPFGMAMPEGTNAAGTQASSGSSSFGANSPAEPVDPVQPAARTRFEGLEVPPVNKPKATPEPQAQGPSQSAMSASPDQPVAPPGAAGTAGGADPVAAPAGLDAMQWWGAITQQFQSIAAQAVKEVTVHANQMAAAAAAAATPAPGTAPVSTPRPSPSRKAPAQKTPQPVAKAAPAQKRPMPPGKPAAKAATRPGQGAPQPAAKPAPAAKAKTKAKGSGTKPAVTRARSK